MNDGGTDAAAAGATPTGTSHRAQLSSTASSLEELVARVASAADDVADEHEGLAADLYEVERSLRTATRRLATVLRRMGSA